MRLCEMSVGSFGVSQLVVHHALGWCLRGKLVIC